LAGENAERERLSERFGRVVANWYGIMSRTKRLTAFTRSYAQAAEIFPYILAAPAYFADKIQLGGMMQTGSAFGSVQGAVSFFVANYRELAEWRAVLARLDGFQAAIDKATTLAGAAGSIKVVSQAGSDKIDLEQLLVRLPNGTPQVSADGFSVRRRERVLVTGPSGAGKSTLFRAIAGVWPFGSGSIAIPAGATLMMLPQRPYFPVGPLKDAVAYPAQADAISSEKVRDAVLSVGLVELAQRLDEEAHWNRMLSLGEQQRLGLARALLHAPQYLFLDEATASIDEPAEAALYRLLQEKLPDTTIVSIGHRSTLTAFHSRNAVLVREGDRFALHSRGEIVTSAKS
jgi:putative ATP-binding cassette transporter